MAAPVEALVDEIIAAKCKNPQADVSTQEAALNRRIYALCGLSEEIQLVKAAKGLI